jgi:hypothetical protein
MDTAQVSRKEFTNVSDALLAQRAELFVSQQPHGAGTWPDGSVLTPTELRGLTLTVSDKVGTDRGGPLRHIQVHKNGRLIVTFVYSHFQRILLRTF